jgi:hypothetical protein
MQKFREEVQAAFDSAQAGDRPFGLLIRNGCFVITATKGHQAGFSDAIESKGCLWVVLANPTLRPRKVPVATQVRSQRVKLLQSEPRRTGDWTAEIDLRVAANYGERPHAPDSTEDIAFEVVTTGEEEITTSCRCRTNFRTVSAFRVATQPRGGAPEPEKW